MSDKKYRAVKKVSLADLSDGWDQECYAYVQPSTYEDQKALIQADLGKKKEPEQVDFQLKFVRDHFISGVIKQFDGESFEPVEMTEDDTSLSIAITDHLYAAIMGFELNPKDIRKAAEESALQTNEETPTETSSSEEQPTA